MAGPQRRDDDPTEHAPSAGEDSGALPPSDPADEALDQASDGLSVPRQREDKPRAGPRMIGPFDSERPPPVV